MMHPSLKSPAPTELGAQSREDLASEAVYSGTVAEVRRYGSAGLLILQERSAEAGRLAVWVHDSVFQAGPLSALRAELSDTHSVARLERQVRVRVRGFFRSSPWADRLTVDVLRLDDIEIDTPPAR